MTEGFFDPKIFDPNCFQTIHVKAATRGQAVTRPPLPRELIAAFFEYLKVKYEKRKEVTTA